MVSKAFCVYLLRLKVISEPAIRQFRVEVL
jgi:hypothetical protein